MAITDKAKQLLLSRDQELHCYNTSLVASLPTNLLRSCFPYGANNCILLYSAVEVFQLTKSVGSRELNSNSCSSGLMSSYHIKCTYSIQVCTVLNMSFTGT